MTKQLAQSVVADEQGRLSIAYDWYPKPLPANIDLEEMAYPDTSYSFTTFFSRKPKAFRLGYASGNYGHGIFTAGTEGVIHVGNYVVLQCTRIIANEAVTIKDHCMFSWGSVLTDSWLDRDTYSIEVRRGMLEQAASSPDRHLQFVKPKPIVIEENVWVGFDAIVLPGVTIGRGAVIGCKAIVTEDVPPYAVVVGSPGRVIKFLQPNDTDDERRQAISAFGGKYQMK
jgi:acetyltransferase-like isoleucine patch superfamily enzyme